MFLSKCFQAAPKPRGRGFPSDHESRPLSISGHHVTEAIGDMYGDGDSDHERQASLGGDEGFDFKKLNSKGHSNGVDGSSQRTGGRPTSRLVPSKSWDANLPTKGSSGSRSDEPPRSPTLSIRSQTSLSDAASSHFPLDYDSSPAAVAQELSNLQALRRMSMDVSSLADPDLPSFNFVPPTAPKGSDSEDDPSRLFWVPARLHPELAPKEFKLFVETRVKEIRRPSTSSDGGSLSPNSAGGSHTLRRKKSMLSRQIEADGKTAETYEDGAERLERRKSQRGDRPPTVKVSDLEKLDELVKDPSSLMRKLSLTSAANGEGNRRLYRRVNNLMLTVSFFFRFSEAHVNGRRSTDIACSAPRPCFEAINTDAVPSRRQPEGDARRFGETHGQGVGERGRASIASLWRDKASANGTAALGVTASQARSFVDAQQAAGRYSLRIAVSLV